MGAGPWVRRAARSTAAALWRSAAARPAWVGGAVGGGGCGGGESSDSEGESEGAGGGGGGGFALPAWLGRRGWVVAGSDCGGAWVYDRASGLPVARLPADADVCNAVRPHPSEPLLATSGIENVVRLWRCAGFGGGAPLGGGGGEEGPRAGAGAPPLPPPLPPQQQQQQLAPAVAGTQLLRTLARGNQGEEAGPVYDRTYNPRRRLMGDPNARALLALLSAEDRAGCPVQ